MDMIRQLNEAKANGLSKEEFFQLLDMELKLNESRKQNTASDLNSSSSSSLTNSAGVSSFRELKEWLENQQQQQYRNLQLMIQQQSDKQSQQIKNEFQRLEQNLQILQESQGKLLEQQVIQQQQLQLQQYQSKLSGNMPKWEVQDFSDFRNKSDKSRVQEVEDMIDHFKEMRQTILNRLQEEKTFMRDSLSTAQQEILSLLAKINENVIQVKDVAGASSSSSLGRQIEEIKALLDRHISTQQKQFCETDQGFSAAKGNTQLLQNSHQLLLQDLELMLEKNFAKFEDNIREELCNVTMQNPVKSLIDGAEPVRHKNTEAPPQAFQVEAKLATESLNEPSKCVLYYFYINGFERCMLEDQIVENSSVYVDGLNSKVKGYVQFVGGAMEVWLSSVSDPSVKGYKQRHQLPAAMRVHVKVLAARNPSLPVMEVGEKSFWWNPVFSTSESPVLIGSISCNEIIKADVKDESGAVLLVYRIYVVDF